MLGPVKGGEVHVAGGGGVDVPGGCTCPHGVYVSNCMSEFQTLSIHKFTSLIRALSCQTFSYYHAASS